MPFDEFSSTREARIDSMISSLFSFGASAVAFICAPGEEMRKRIEFELLSSSSFMIFWNNPDPDHQVFKMRYC